MYYILTKSLNKITFLSQIFKFIPKTKLIYGESKNNGEWD